MKKMFALLVGIICLISTACNTITQAVNPPQMSTSSIEISVTSIDISTIPENPDYIRHYLDNDKIEEIRSYLRRLTWQDITTEKPDDESGMLYLLTLSYEDGTSRNYYFKEDQYFKFDGIDWKIISSVDDIKNIIQNNPTD